MQATRNFELPYITASQALKHITYNEALEILDALVHLRVEGELPAPPAAAADGARYIVAASAQGAWAAHGGAVAQWQDGAWRFHVPRPGWIASMADTRQLRVWDGQGWSAPEIALTATQQLGVNTAASPDNRLAVASDATLFTHAGAGHQLKINKSAPGSSASVLFQTAYEGQAEIGTTGDDGLHIRTRQSTGDWQDRVFVDRETGVVGVGTTSPAVGGASGAAVHVHAGKSGAQWSVSRYTVGSESGPNDGLIVGNLGGSAYLWNYKATPLFIGTNSTTRVIVSAAGDVGIGVSNPSCRLHVDGPVRTGAYTLAAKPAAGAVGAGGLILVTDAAGGPVLAYSDGSIWRRVTDAAPLA